MNPVPRRDLVLSDLGDEIVIYDPVTRQAHNLQKEAAGLFRALEGGHTPIWDDLALSILHELEQAGLLEEPLEGPQDSSRRQLLARASRFAGAGFLASIVVATPAAAQSGVTEAMCDGSSGEFCGQLCIDAGPIGSRVCASITGFPGGACGCVPAPGACACV